MCKKCLQSLMVGIPANVSRSVVYRKIGENILDRRKQRKDQMLPQGTLLKRILFFFVTTIFFSSNSTKDGLEKPVLFGKIQGRREGNKEDHIWMALMYPKQKKKKVQ